MDINKLLLSAALNVRTLGQRLSVQMSATHDPQDKAELREWIEACQSQSDALKTMASAYGPIIQSAIETGIAGKTHKIVVSERAESKLTGEEIFVTVSEHLFTVDTDERVGPADC
jgi:hypothetical protein